MASFLLFPPEFIWLSMSLHISETLTGLPLSTGSLQAPRPTHTHIHTPHRQGGTVTPSPHISLRKEHGEHYRTRSFQMYGFFLKPSLKIWNTGGSLGFWLSFFFPNVKRRNLGQFMELKIQCSKCICQMVC